MEWRGYGSVCYSNTVTITLNGRLNCAASDGSSKGSITPSYYWEFVLF
jgi:hypothetical protein